MSTTGNVVAITNALTATLYADDVNEKNMVYFANKSGTSRTSGEVVVLDTSNSEAFTTTTSEGNVKVLGVIPQIDNATRVAGTQTIANNASGYVQTSDKIAAVNMEGTTAIGDYLIASATAGKAKAVSVWQDGVFGVATSACTGAGTVSAVLFSTQQRNHAGGTNTHTQIDTAVTNSVAHLVASAEIHGLAASVNVLGDRAAVGEFVQRGSVSVNGIQAVTFPVAFGTAIYAVLVTPMTYAGQPYVFSLDSVSTSGFTIRSGAGGAHTCYWLAIGK